MSNNRLIMWPSPEVLQAMPLSKTFEPQNSWDNEARQWSSEQEILEGLPVWKSEALMHVGYGRALTPVEVRVLSKDKPAYAPDPLKLARMLGVPVQAQQRGA